MDGWLGDHSFRISFLIPPISVCFSLFFNSFFFFHKLSAHDNLSCSIDCIPLCHCPVTSHLDQIGHPMIMQRKSINFHIKAVV